MTTLKTSLKFLKTFSYKVMIIISYRKYLLNFLFISPYEAIKQFHFPEYVIRQPKKSIQTDKNQKLNYNLREKSKPFKP